MTGKIILHIGPPKTGTTSLQYALKKISHPNFFYGGIYQPRNCLQYYDLGRQLYRFCVDKKMFDENLLRDIVAKLVEKFAVVFLSEEMFLLHNEKVGVDEKIRNAVNLLDGFDVTLLYTYRSPKSAIPSLFQELYPKLPRLLARDFEKFASSKYAKVYDLDEVQKIVNGLGGVKFRVLNIFDFYKSDDRTLDVVLDDSQFKDVVLDISNKNKGKKSGKLRELSRDNFFSSKVNRISRRLQTSRFGNYELARKLCHVLDELGNSLKTRVYFDEKSLSLKKTLRVGRE